MVGNHDVECMFCQIPIKLLYADIFNYKCCKSSFDFFFFCNINIGCLVIDFMTNSINIYFSYMKMDLILIALRRKCLSLIELRVMHFVNLKVRK